MITRQRFIAGLAVIAAFLVSTAHGAEQRGGLQFTFLGNAAVMVTDGTRTLMSDFPYESGAFGYMTYDRAAVTPVGDVTLLITHAHRDHFLPSLLSGTTWKVIAPAGMTPAVGAGHQGTLDALKAAGIHVRPVVTPHGRIAHQSYRVEWNGLALYFTGDTDDLTALLAQRDLDVAFVTPWLWKAAHERRATINAKQIVIYHHGATEQVPNCSGTCRVPTQGASWKLSTNGVDYSMPIANFRFQIID